MAQSSGSKERASDDTIVGKPGVSINFDAIKNHCNRAPSSRSAVFLTVDTGYFCHALFVIEAIARSNPRHDFDFCIVTTDILPDHKLLDRHEVRVCRLALGAAFASLPSSERISVASYLRLFVPRVFQDEYDRLLYLDSDIVYRRGDISALIQSDLGGRPIAGVREPSQLRRKNFTPDDMTGLGLGFFKMMNAGVQLIDTRAFNALEVGERAIELAFSKPDKMLAYDQTALNAVLHGDFAELSPVWNWLYGFRTIYYTELYDPAIIHFAGRRKPWNHLNGEFPIKYSNLYRDFYGEHFPEKLAAMPASAKPSQVKLRHLRYFIKHIVDLGRFLPEMDEFKGDFDIKH